jgi:hypothetical protein
MTAEQWISLIEQALWPAVVVVLTFVLRQPVGAFFGALAGRVTKLSVASVSVELALAQPAEPPWQGVGGDDVRGLVVAQQVNDSYFHTLREALAAPGSADYFVVDLRSGGDQWLTSRLYLFSYLLGRLKGIRAVVFVATRGDVARSFLAVASVEAVLRALATAQPWLRGARLEAEADFIGRLPNPTMPTVDPVTGAPAPSVPADVDEWWAGVRSGTAYTDPLQVAQKFLERVQWQQPPGVADPDGVWLRLPDQPVRPRTWEHATWLQPSDLTDGVLRDTVQPDCYVIDDRLWTAEESVRAVAAAPGEFVALLSPSRRFGRLVDRRSLLETLGETYARSAKAG